MAIRGRKPKVGTKKRSKGDSPAISTGVFDKTCPSWLDAYGQEAWNRLVPVIVEAELVEAADYDAVAEYCDFYSLRRRAREELGNNAISKDDGKSYHQALNAISLTSKAMRSLASEMGLTPTSRMRLRGSREEGGDDDDGISEHLD